MKFRIENQAFGEALGAAKNCVPSAQTMPILGCIVISTEEGRIRLRATNLDREVELAVAADITEPGAAAIRADLLTALIKKLPKGGDSELEVTEERAFVVSGRSRYELRTLPADTFPSPKLIEEQTLSTTFGMPAADLRRMLLEVSYCANEQSPYLYGKGVYLHVVGPPGKPTHLVAVATDHHRLGRQQIAIPEGAAGMPGITIPVQNTKAMSELLAGCEGDVRVSVSHAMIQLTAPGHRLTSALIDAQYPAYEKVVPERGAAAASLRPYALAEAIDRATLVFMGAVDPQKLGPRVRFSTEEGNVQVVAAVRGGDQGVETVEAETNGQDANFTVSAPYFSEALKMWPEDMTVDIQQNATNQPILLSCADRPDTLHLIMPVVA